MLFQIVNTIKIVKQPFAQHLPKLKSGKLTLAFLKCIKCTHKESRVYTNFYMRKVYIIGDYCVMRVRLLLEEFRSSNQIFFLTPILIGNLSLMYVCSYLSPAVTRKQQPLIYKVNRCLARYSPRATTTNRPTSGH